MSNTALRAEKAKKIIFISDAHKKFYYVKAMKSSVGENPWNFAHPASLNSPVLTDWEMDMMKLDYGKELLEKRRKRYQKNVQKKQRRRHQKRR